MIFLKSILVIINKFISKKERSELILFIKKELGKTENLLKGISLVREITPNTYSKIHCCWRNTFKQINL